jgi:hypothetical protein
VRSLSWNLRPGGRRRLDPIVAAIASHEPDVVVVTSCSRTAPQLVAAFGERPRVSRTHIPGQQ